MVYTCPICNHEKRVDIESAILAGQPQKAVAEFYDINPTDLLKHVANCASYVLSLDEFDQQVQDQLASTNHAVDLSAYKSIRKQLSLKEADLLAETANEYMITLKNLGRKINKIINSDDPVLMGRVIRKPIADMYVQMGGEIRQTVKTMAELDRLLKGPEENPLTGLQALASAIHTSAALAAVEKLETTTEK